MCFEYYERLQRQGDQRKQELIELQKRQTERDLGRAELEQEAWELPQEPAQPRQKVPA